MVDMQALLQSDLVALTSGGTWGVSSILMLDHPHRYSEPFNLGGRSLGQITAGATRDAWRISFGGVGNSKIPKDPRGYMPRHRAAWGKGRVTTGFPVPLMEGLGRAKRL